MTDVDHAEELLDEAELALDEGDPELALELCDRALRIAPEHPGAYFVQGDAFRILGLLEEAVHAYRLAALGRPDHAASWASLALSQFELLDFESARHSVSRALHEDPANPEAWWVRSLLQERRDDMAGSHRSLLHARWLDPMGFPLPPRLTDEQVEHIVQEAVSELHPTIQDYLANVAILLEDVPDLETLTQYDPPASPLELLGYFSGHSLMERSEIDPWSNLPGTIVLFRRNLERHARDPQELVDELRVTLFHEVGHFLGLDEDDLLRRGLD